MWRERLEACGVAVASYLCLCVCAGAHATCCASGMRCSSIVRSVLCLVVECDATRVCGLKHLKPLTCMKRWCLDRLRGDDNTQPPLYPTTLNSSGAPPSSIPLPSSLPPSPLSIPPPPPEQTRQTQRQSAQPPWVDDRFGSMGGPLRFNSIFTRLFQPFMSAIFYAQVSLAHMI